MLDLKKYFLGSFVFLCSFECALLGLNPTFYMDDSPEFVTAANTLGIAHPPGYPLFMMIGRLFALLPLPACFRINLLSALFAALVSVLIYYLLNNEFKLPASASFTFALAWMAGNTAYPGALSAKTGVYELAAVFLLAILACLLRGNWIPAAFLFGLSLGNHWMSMAAYMPGLAYLAYKKSSREPWNTCKWTKAALFCLLGLSVYLFLPLRSINGPLVNWGNPSNWTLFFQHVSRYVDQGKDFSPAPSFWLKDFIFYLFSAVKEFWGFGLLVVFGLFFEYKKNPPRALGLVIAWAGLITAISVFSKYSGEKLYLFQDYSISSMVFVLLFSALGFWDCVTFLKARSASVRIIPMILLVLCLWGVGYRVATQGESHYTYTYDFALNSWKSLPSNSLYFCSGDAIEFPCWYLQWIEGKRPDLCVAGSSLSMDWFRINLALSHPGLIVPEAKYIAGRAYFYGPLSLAMIKGNPQKNIYYSYVPVPQEQLDDLDMAPAGLALKIVFAPHKALLQEGLNNFFWWTARIRNMESPVSSIDQRTQNLFLKNYGSIRSWTGLYYVQQAGVLKSKPHPKADEIRALYEKSLESFLRAYQWNPSNPEYAINVGANDYCLGDLDGAKTWIQKVTQSVPGDSEMQYDAGVLVYKANDIFDAREWFLKALQTDPSHQQARHALQKLYQSTASNQISGFPSN